MAKSDGGGVLGRHQACTGAILMLVFAVTQGLFWAGVAAKFAMACGTPITVAVLAVFAFGSRELALKLGGTSGTWANVVWTTCAIGGAVVIFLFGALLFAASLGATRRSDGSAAANHGVSSRNKRAVA